MIFGKDNHIGLCMVSIQGLRYVRFYKSVSRHIDLNVCTMDYVSIEVMFLKHEHLDVALKANKRA